MDKFKTIISIGAFGLVGMIAFLYWQNGQLKDTRADQLQEINTLHWMLSAKEAENDSIKNIGEYTEIDTVWQTKMVAKTDTISGKVDTVYEDMATISGSIKIDTTKEYGPESNRLSVHVSGQFYYPEEYSYRNWLLIVPSFKEAPYVPVTRSQKSVGIGLNYLRSFSGRDYFGVSVRYKAFTVVGSYDPWRKSLISGISVELLTF